MLNIRAEDKAGVWNDGYNVFELFYGTAPVSDVINPQVTPGNGQLTVSWEVPSDPNYAYASVEYRDASDSSAQWTSGGTANDPSQTSLTITGLANGTPYQVRVIAYNSANQNGNYVVLEGTYTPDANISTTVRLYVNHPTAGTLTVELTPNDTVLALKQAIEAQSGTPVNQQVLTYNNATLQDAATLSSCGLSSGATVQLTIQNGGSGSSGQVTLTINQAGQSPFTVNIELTRTVLDLKSRIKILKNIPVANQRLFNGPTEMMDNLRSLMDYGVAPNAQLTLQVTSGGSGGTFGITIDQQGYPPLSLSVASTDTVQDLKNRIQGLRSIPANSQRLFKGSVELADNFQTLGSYGVQPNDHLTLQVNNGGTFPFNITISQAGQPSFTLDVLGTDPVSDVKTRIEGQTGVPAAQQRLFKGSVELSDDQQTLAAYGIGPNDTLTLQVQPAGPSFANWQQKRFPAGAAKTGPDDDYDQDGLKNFFEYAIGGDPTQAGDQARLPKVYRHSNGRLRLKYVRRSATTDVQWRVDYRPTLSDPWTEADPYDMVEVSTRDQGDGTEEVELEYQPSPGNIGFFRVVAIRQP